jgi:hypothetical protein
LPAKSNRRHRCLAIRAHPTRIGPVYDAKRIGPSDSAGTEYRLLYRGRRVVVQYSLSYCSHNQNDSFGSRCRHRFNFASICISTEEALNAAEPTDFSRPPAPLPGACERDARPHQNSISSASVAPSCTIAVVTGAQNHWTPVERSRRRPRRGCRLVFFCGSGCRLVCRLWQLQCGKREAVMYQYHVTQAAVASKLAVFFYFDLFQNKI